MPDEFADLDFRHTLRDANNGLVVKPVLHNYLTDASFPRFVLEFPKQEMAREPDGWFHPSTHPLWNERQLFHYLVHPDAMENERLQYMSTLSITVGKAMHGFIEMCLTDSGLRPHDLQRCTVCPPERECVEAGVVDEETGSRGHMDGILELGQILRPFQESQPLVEFKTSNQAKLRKIKDLDLEAFKATWPVYWAQVQEYMRLSGRRMAVVLFMSMGFPWEMREFHVPYDRGHNEMIREKYLNVRALAKMNSTVSLRCCGKPKDCPARLVCTMSGL
jgi:hypothetical protein